MNNQIRVLAIDDAVANLMILKGSLKGDDFKLVTTNNALEGLRLFKQEFFDVVLLDVIMPGIDGFELRKLIREVDMERPIIFLTSMVEDGSMKMLNQIVWDTNTFYLNKVTDKETLVRKIREVVANHRIRNVERQRSHKLEDELKLAGDLQRLLLPEWCRIDEHMIMSSIYQPALHVSGDIFEVIPMRGSKYLLFIGDIAGHGVSAALYMATVLSWLKVVVKEKEYAPHELLTELNRFFCRELRSSTYMTALVAILDFEQNHLALHSAGHPPLCFGSPTEKVLRRSNTDKGSIPIGWFSEAEYPADGTSEYNFCDDTIFITMTDGVFDIENDRQETLSEEDYLEIVTALLFDTDCLLFPYRLKDMLEKMGYGNMPDDFTIVAVTKNNPDPRLKQHLVPGNLSAVSMVAEDFASITADQEQATKIDLLMHEYLNNVMIHGKRGGPNRKQDMIYTSIRSGENGGLTVRGLEFGSKWNLSEAPRDEVETPAEEEDRLATSGRGMQILHSITNYIAYNTYAGLNETQFVLKDGGSSA